MKNIHLIPTDKPSRLFYNVGGQLLFTIYQNYNGVNIYITSDEEIKEGDWVYCVVNEMILTEGKETSKICLATKTNIDWSYKIILTTDQDLIKDGVQAIDDEFLEWFVKNPSCESVEVESMVNMIQFTPREFIYKIIIPQEEPIIELYMPKYTLGMDTINEQEEPKQETLEEAANKFAKTTTPENKFEEGLCVGKTLGFIEGAKWQADRMYSEEEVRQMFNRYNEIIAHRDVEEWQPWIEKQFKKK